MARRSTCTAHAWTGRRLCGFLVDHCRQDQDEHEDSCDNGHRDDLLAALVLLGGELLRRRRKDVAVGVDRLHPFLLSSATSSHIHAQPPHIQNVSSVRMACRAWLGAGDD